MIFSTLILRLVSMKTHIPVTDLGAFVCLTSTQRRRPAMTTANVKKTAGAATGLALVLLCSLPGIAQASTYSAVVVYGDSLSDNGNLFAATGQAGSPYYDGRRSNGPVAVEQLATLLNAPLLDFAWVGATTGIGNLADGGTPTSFGVDNLPGMQTEVAYSAASIGPYLSNGLFVVWGGPDDFLSPSPLDTTVAQIVARAVSDELGIVQNLQTLGAKHILVPGMPDLGLTPYFQSLPGGGYQDLGKRAGGGDPLEYPVAIPARRTEPERRSADLAQFRTATPPERDIQAVH
jgi:GDSL-like Lipase/Acylhydrolase